MPNTIYKDDKGVHVSAMSYAEDMAALPPPDFDGLPLEKYFVPTKVLPYLATRGCYWGRCEFCDHGEGYTAGYRSKKIQDVLAEIKYLRDKYGARHFHFTDESYPPALFRKLVARPGRRARWTSSGPPTCGSRRACSEEAVWQDAKDSGCRYLHFGYESGVRAGAEADGQGDDDRDHDEASASSRRRPASGTTAWASSASRVKRERKPGSRCEFLEQNKNYVHSLGFGTFDLGRHNPVAKHPEKWGVTAYKNPEWDLALDYYFTVKNGMSIEEAERVFQEFERNHYAGWDLRLYHPRIYFSVHLRGSGCRSCRICNIRQRKLRASRRLWQVRCNVITIMSSDLLQIDGLAPLKNGARKTSKVMLLFPPEWVPTAPYLALPSLTAVLREAGHHVIQRDINIEMYDHFFTTEFLIWIKARQVMQLKALQDEREAGRADATRKPSQMAVLEQADAVDVFDLADRGRGCQADRARRAVLRSRQARTGAEYLPRSDAVHLRRLLSGFARVLSDGKQPRLPARRLQGSAWPVSTTSR